MERILRLLDKASGPFEQMVSPNDEHGVKKLFGLFACALIVVFGVLLLDVMLSLFGVTQHGTFGDFFGGVANPLLTFLTFFGLLITIVLQKEELKETRKELAKSASALDEQVEQFKYQANVSAFYKMLDNHMSLVSSVRFESKDDDTAFGRDALKHYRDALVELFDSKVRTGSETSLQKIFKLAPDNPEAAKSSFNAFWSSNGEELQAYIAYVRLIFSYLESQLHFDTDLVAMYSSLFTDSERALVFYYAITVDDEDFSRQLSKNGFCVGIDSSFLMHKDHEAWLADCCLPKVLEEKPA